MGGRATEGFGFIKEYLSYPPVLVPPQKGIPFRLYLSADEKLIGSVLIQELEGKERAAFFIQVVGFWMQKQGILRWRSCAYVYIFLVRS